MRQLGMLHCFRVLIYSTSQLICDNILFKIIYVNIFLLSYIICSFYYLYVWHYYYMFWFKLRLLTYIRSNCFFSDILSFPFLFSRLTFSISFPFSRENMKSDVVFISNIERQKKLGIWRSAQRSYNWRDRKLFWLKEDNETN